ncbi:MAG: 4Fe-4S binding protein [Clostridia bacterium]|nr:4Fe-4S binding protein [Clostridia bacterium]
MDNQTKKSTKRQGFRLLSQCAFAALSNGYLAGFAKGKIYTGVTKRLCVPGMNCYSCPGAFASCPIGALQATVGNRNFHLSLYVFGFLVAVGALLGRGVCGFLCPFGLLQELLYKIPLPKKKTRRRLPGESALRALKYVMLFLFVLLLPMAVTDITGQGEPWFCKYICPVGTLEAGIPLVLLNKGLQSAVGFLYAWKLWILAVLLVLSLWIWRPFCRYLCPLGALYGFFNRFALYRYTVDETKCLQCNACRAACKLDLPVWEKPNGIDCVRCGACLAACPTGALGTLISLQKKQSKET